MANVMVIVSVVGVGLFFLGILKLGIIGYYASQPKTFVPYLLCMILGVALIGGVRLVARMMDRS